MPGTKVQFIRVFFGDRIDLNQKQRNYILRFYERKEYDKQVKKGFNMLNDDQILTPEKSIIAKQWINESGTTARQRRTTCK